MLTEVRRQAQTLALIRGIFWRRRTGAAEGHLLSVLPACVVQRGGLRAHCGGQRPHRHQDRGLVGGGATFLGGGDPDRADTRGAQACTRSATPLVQA